MNVTNNADYNNTILEALVVNTDTGMDPEGRERIQIYIPSIHWEFQNIYQEYMNAGDKVESGHKDKFPWAVNLVQGLEVGNTVYVSNINNKDDQYIIIGAESNTTTNYIRNINNGSGGVAVYNTIAGGLLDYVMPIIIHNEVGIDVNQWPDSIPDKYYSNINPTDNGGWSIGLIQWHEPRAYDVLHFITTQDSDWESRFTDKSCELYTDLKQGSTNARVKYQSGFRPAVGSSIYNSIASVLGGSEMAKRAQRSYASQDTSSNISKCVNAGVTNEAIVIFLADLMNQYGSNLPSTIQNAASISNNGMDPKSQFDSFISYCKGNSSLHYDRYKTRRSDTVEYINNLFNSGIFGESSSSGTNGKASAIVNSGLSNPGAEPVSLGGLNIGSDEAAASGYIFPIPGHNKANSGLGGTYKKHGGVDITISEGISGKNVVAVADGTVIQSNTWKYSNGEYGSYGEYIEIKHADGNSTLYGHMQPGTRQFSVGQTVKQGDVIGLADNTGNSTGPHLHFEVRVPAGNYRVTGSNIGFHTKYLP